MILEHARIPVVDGHGPAFEEAVARAVAEVLPRARGFRSLRLARCVEEPGTYLCALEWDDLEAHTVDFRQGPLFPEWRALIGPHFREAPQVLHYEPVGLAGGPTPAAQDGAPSAVSE